MQNNGSVSVVIDSTEKLYTDNHHSINIDEIPLNINNNFDRNDISDTKNVNSESRHIKNNLNSETVNSDFNNDYYVLDAVSTNSGING